MISPQYAPTSEGRALGWGILPTGCGKKALVCHSERSEESLFDLSIGKEKKGEILRFAQNDRVLGFSAACSWSRTANSIVGTYFQGESAAEVAFCFVIPNEVRNLCRVYMQEKRDSSARNAPRNDKPLSFSAS
jgi:hypothetical protein